MKFAILFCVYVETGSINSFFLDTLFFFPTMFQMFQISNIFLYTLIASSNCCLRGQQGQAGGWSWALPHWPWATAPGEAPRATPTWYKGRLKKQKRILHLGKIFSVANSNSSFYGGWSLSHSLSHWVMSHFKGWEVQKVNRGLWSPLGQKDFQRIKGFCWWWGVRKTIKKRLIRN